MKKLQLLGGLTVSQFLRDYWQKRPLLIHQAIPDFQPLLSRAALFDLAADREVESRLISNMGGRWRLQHGPFEALPGANKKQWTVLVQGVNLHCDAADDLLRQFGFLPYARLDDLMISYASDGGGVGPHVDSYDVFLLQAHGKRRWRIAAQDDLSLVEGLPLKILRHFEAEQEFILEPGDMLYLPPQYAHDGQAIGECMTYSIGFRAPSYQELGEAFMQFLAETIDLEGRYADPDLLPPRQPAALGKAMVRQVADVFRTIRFDDSDVAIFLGEYLSEPKASVVFDAPQRPLSRARFVQAAGKNGIMLSRKAQMLHCNKNIFINGESFTVTAADRAPLLALADQRRLAANEVQSASEDVWDALYDWYCAGWILLAPK